MQRTITARTIYNRYAALFRMPLAENLAYLGNFISATLAMVMFMWIFGMLWRAVFTHQGVDRIAGMTFNDTLWYLLMAELVVLSKPLLAMEIAGVHPKRLHCLRPDAAVPLRALSPESLCGPFRASLNLVAGGIVVWGWPGRPLSGAGLCRP